MERFTAEALECLQVAAEALIIHLFEDSVLVMVNAKRKTLMEKDVQLIRLFRALKRESAHFLHAEHVKL